MGNILVSSSPIFAGLFTLSIKNFMKNTNQSKEGVILTKHMSLSVFKI